MEQMSDTTRPDFHVRRDVARSPGGDATVYKTKCAGCHSGMDALAGAWAHFDFSTDRVIYTPGNVQAKINQNGHEFPEGYITNDDSWMNNWLKGQNSRVGWLGAEQGNGPQELGRMLSETKQFPKCMAQRVFKKVCLRSPTLQKDQDAINNMADEFSSGQTYNMKNLFSMAVEACITE
jgi:hypothetical protein